MIERIATRYGNWVAVSRFPTRKYVRRLAASNPTDFGKYALESMLGVFFRTIQITRLQREVKRLRAENEALKALTTDDTFMQLLADLRDAGKPKDVRDKL